MGLEGLTDLEILHGTFTLVQTLFYFLIGLRLLLNYFSTKKFEFITVGATWIFISSAWWPATFSFVHYLIYGITLSPFWFFFVGSFFLPVSILCWIYSFCKLVYPKLMVHLMLIFTIICVLFEIFILYYLFNDTSQLGVRREKFFYSPALVPMLFQVLMLLVALITGILFTRHSLRSKDPKIQWKGRFLLLGFVTFSIAGIIDAAVPLAAWSIVVIRIILIIAAFGYYLGFMLPDWLAEKLHDWKKYV